MLPRGEREPSAPCLPPAQLAPALLPSHPVPDHCSQLTIPREFYKDGTDKTETVLILGLWTTACCTACLIWYHSCTFHCLPTIFGPVRYKSTPSPALSLLHRASSPSCRQVGQKWIPGEGFLPASPPAPCLAPGPGLYGRKQFTPLPDRADVISSEHLLSLWD